MVRLLVKNMGRGIPESVVREELESLRIHVQGVTQLRSGRRDQDPTKDRPSTPHIIVSVARGPEVSRVRSIIELCGLRVSVESYVAPKGPLQYKRCQRFGHTQRNCGYAPRCFACGGSRLSGGCSTPREQPHCCGCEGNHTANYPGCIKEKDARVALANQAPERTRKNAATGHPAAPKSQRAGPYAEQVDLGEGRKHVIQGERVAKVTTTTTPPPNSSPQPVTEATERPKLTATRKKASPKNPETKSTAVTKPAAGKAKKKAAASVKTAAAKPATPDLVVPTQIPTSPLEYISDLLDRLLLHSCVELTHRLLTSIVSLTTGAARPRAVLKTAILFVAEYGSTPKEERTV